LFSKLTICGTAKVHIGIDKPVAAVATFAGCIIFEKFHQPAAFRAIGLEYGPRLPVLCILSWAFHFNFPCRNSIKLIEEKYSSFLDTILPEPVCRRLDLDQNGQKNGKKGLFFWAAYTR
jgi:hypothetical protein